MWDKFSFENSCRKFVADTLPHHFVSGVGVAVFAARRCSSTRRLEPPAAASAVILRALVNVLASVIEPKFAHAMVRKLNQAAPLENLRHVKRVQKRHLDDGKTQLSVILCLASDGNVDVSDLPKDVAELINTYQLSIFVTQVCKYAATSKEEWEEQCKLWPTSFHPPTYNIEGIAGFSEEGSRTIFTFMQDAIKLAKAGKEVVNAAIIVDPSSNQVIATARDDICSWHISPDENGTEKEIDSLKHSEAFASSCLSNGYLSNKLISNYDNDQIHLYTDVQCLNPWQWSQRSLSTSSSCYWHPLRHAALMAIEKSADRDRTLFPSTGNVSENFIQADPLATCSPAKRMRVTSNGADNEKVSNDAAQSDLMRPYLCTGFDIYLAWEPCVMCAMALVHQRIRRIFYAFPNPHAGALGSVHRLQGEKSLNHHYAVFRVKLPNDLGSVISSHLAAQKKDL
ncbi:hypothetical protein V2J09_020667 [Rumex salicifolius]